MSDQELTSRSWQCIQAIDYVKANPGCEGQAVADALGWSRRYIRRVLAAASAGGTIGHIRSAMQKAHWFPADKLAAAKKAELTRQKANKREQDLLRRLADGPRPIRAVSRWKPGVEVDTAQPKMVDLDQDVGEEIDTMPMVRRLVLASESLPVECDAYSSVFAWGKAVGVAAAAQKRVEQEVKAAAAKRKASKAGKTKGKK